MQRLSDRPPLRVTLDESDFRRLCLGQAIPRQIVGQRIEIVLAPMLWEHMLAAITDAMAADTERRAAKPPDPPEAREFLPQRRKAPRK